MLPAEFYWHVDYELYKYDGKQPGFLKLYR